MSVRSNGSAKKPYISAGMEEPKRRASIVLEPVVVSDDFDEVLNLVGARGKYQQWLLYGFVCPFTAIMPFFILNTVFMFYEPDHWCHVPGRPSSMSLDEWKNLTIPFEAGPDGELRHSQCQMYAKPRTNSEYGPDSVEILACNSGWGWDYDRTDYKETLVTQYNWVCERKEYATTAFTLFAAGNCVGTIVLGWAGDKFGRKLIFFLTIAINLGFRMISLFLAKYFYVFLTLQFLTGLSFPMMYIAPFTTIAEICEREYRSRVYAVSWMIWVIGICALPLIAYLCADWFLIGLMTTIPGFPLFIYYKYLPESPRLLLSKGNTDEAMFYLNWIARVNGTQEECNKDNKLLSMVKQLEVKRKEERTKSGGGGGDSKRIGFWTLFTKCEIAKFTTYLCIVWSANQLIYYGITLNTTAMAGNQFLNFFILSIIELPAGWVGGMLVEKTGRRWTQALFLVVCAAAFCGAGVAVLQPELTVLVITSVVFAKFSVSITSLVVNLQANEIFPTQLRATGVGLVSTVAGLFTIGGPVIIYLRNVHPAAPYIALAVISGIGLICSVLLPETLGRGLPETLEESNSLGNDMKFWSFLPGKELSKALPGVLKQRTLRQSESQNGQKPDP